MLNIYDKLGFNKFSKSKLLSLTTGAAAAVSLALFTVKLFVYNSTHSHTVFMMMLDAGFDTCISLFNLFVIRWTLDQTTSKFKYGYDKIIALISLFQGILLIGIIAFHMIHSHSHVSHITWHSIFVLVFAIVMCVLILSLQKYTIKKTNSVIIVADMIHYQTDLLSHLSAIGCLLLHLYYQIAWMDKVVGIFIGVYLSKNSVMLIWRNMKTLLDYENKTYAKQIEKIAHSLNLDIHNISVTTSGVCDVITCDVLFDKTMILSDANAILTEFRTQICAIQAHVDKHITITPVTELISNKPSAGAPHLSCACCSH